MGSSVRPDPASTLPPLHRLLTQDEFHAAQTLTPDALTIPGLFPVLPPIPKAQSDATATRLPRDLTKAQQTDGQPTVGPTQPGNLEAHGAAYNAVWDFANYSDATVRAFIDDVVHKPVRALIDATPEGAVIDAAKSGIEQSAKGENKGAVLGVLAAMPMLGGPLSKEGATFLGRAAEAWKVMHAFSPEMAEAKTILRANIGHMAASYEQAAFKLDEFRRIIDPMPDQVKFDFIHAIETGDHASIDPAWQPFASDIRQTLDQHRDAIRNLGTGKLEHFIEDYFPHIWEDPEKARDAFLSIGAKGPLEGPASFSKERTIPTTKEGLELGLKPVSSNPVDLTLLKLREMQRYLLAHQSLNELKDAELVKFVRSGELPPDGYGRINDKIATVFGPRTGGVSVPEGAVMPLGDDPIPVRQRKLDASAAERASFPMNAQRLVDHAEVKGNGLTPEGIERSAKTLRKAGYSITDDMVREAKAKASQQASGAIDYSMSNMEQGNSVRDRFGETFDDQRKQALGMTDVKPEDVQVFGKRIMGEYWAPEPVAGLVNNYLSPGLPQQLQKWFPGAKGKGLAMTFEAYRGMGNLMNQVQLGLSAFHLGFTSLDATTSRFALGLEHLASGNYGEAAKKVATAPVAAFPGIVDGLNHFFGGESQLGLGAKIRAAYLNPEAASPAMRELAGAVMEAGGRVTQDSYYKNSFVEQYLASLKSEWNAVKEGEIGEAMKHDFAAGSISIPAAIEFAAKPLMEHIVPLQKLQVFGEIAQKSLAELPPDASLAERRSALQSAWDSTDNRMGQLVYDNLFWNKAFKDLAMASTRSVGWNLGTIRELGGGLADIAHQGARIAKLSDGSPELTHRMAYVMALPMVVGSLGAAYQYLRTGEGPKEMKDYFFPRTGDTDADGNPERVQLPSYMKDMFAYAGSPFQTLTHKVSPLPSMLLEMLNNQDFYGDEIRNPQDPVMKQLLQEAEFINKTQVPFGVRNMQESSKRGDDLTTRTQMMFGITPAPREKVRSDAQNRMQEYLNQDRSVGATPEVAEERQARADILRRLRDPNTDTAQLEKAVNDAITNQQLTPPQLARIMKRVGLTPAQEKFKRLTLPQALDVFQRATAREKSLFAEALAKKLEKASSQ